MFNETRQRSAVVLAITLVGLLLVVVATAVPRLVTASEPQPNAGDPNEGNVFLVKDINAGRPGFAEDVDLLTVGNEIFLLGETLGSDVRKGLFVTDGLTEPEFVEGIDGFQPMSMNDKLYFFTVGDNNLRYTYLWESDGTITNTRFITHFNAPIYKSPQHPIVVDDYLYLVIENELGEHVLWRTNGTAVESVKTFTASEGVPNTGFIAYEGKLAFINQKSPFPPPNTYDLWMSDGTLTGTQIITSLGTAQSFSNPAVVAGQLYIGHNNTLIVSGGSPETTYSLAVTGNVKLLTPFQGELFFATEGIGHDLWHTNGTPAGTNKIKDLDTIYRLVATSDHLYFAGSQPAFSNTGLWISDGTPTGTRLFKGDFWNDYPVNLTAVGSQLFLTDRKNHKHDLWVTSGTENSTNLILSLDHVEDFDASHTVHENNLYFIGSVEPHGYELWRSDGTIENTTAVGSDSRGYTHGSGASPLTVFQDRLYLSAADKTLNTELWRSTGTAETTILIEDIFPGYNPHTLNLGGSSPRYPLTTDNAAFFFVNINEQEKGWVAMNKDEEVTQVATFNNYSTQWSYRPVRFAWQNQAIFSYQENSWDQYQTWVSDGTISGTQEIMGFDHLLEAEVFDNTLYFVQAPGVYGDPPSYTLYAATGVLTTAVPIYQSDHALSGLVATDNQLFFREKVTGYILKLLTLDSMSSQPQEIGEFRFNDDGYDVVYKKPLMTVVNDNQLAFIASSADHYNRDIWLSDGTVSGTVSTFASDNLPYNLENTRELVADGSALFFDGQTDDHGRELWTSDGTLTGTFMVKDIFSGTIGSETRELTPIDGKLYFSAIGEPWVSDGTEAGTYQLAELMLGEGYDYPLQSSPNSFTKVGGIIYFSADSLEYGRELWGIALEQLPPNANDDTFDGMVNKSLLIDVLSNDNDPNGDLLTLTAVSTPDYGTAVITDSQIAYTPPTNFAGTATFTYTVNDGTATDTAVVTINVLNNAPIAQNDIITTTLNTALDVLVLANDSDPDDHPLTITAVTTPTNGSTTIQETAIRYTPETNFVGQATFTYTISDGYDTAIAQVTIYVIDDEVVMPTYQIALPLVMSD